MSTTQLIRWAYKQNKARCQKRFHSEINICCTPHSIKEKGVCRWRCEASGNRFRIKEKRCMLVDKSTSQQLMKTLDAIAQKMKCTASNADKLCSATFHSGRLKWTENCRTAFAMKAGEVQTVKGVLGVVVLSVQALRSRRLRRTMKQIVSRYSSKRRSRRLWRSLQCVERKSKHEDTAVIY